MERTFDRISKEINGFVKKILDTNPDYIVPVKKKGCKLLKYVKDFSEELSEKVRYRDYFENNGINLKGMKIAIVDDATKYTSMLFRYRNFFEERDAVVDTYSYVGHDRLNNGEYEQYDSKAYIQIYLEESTYQEYLNQQSRVLIKDNNFFDIDHLVFKFCVSTEKYEEFLESLYKIGDIEFVDDQYTPKNIEKTSIINIDFYGAEALFDQSVSRGGLQKIRIVYNSSTEELFVTPLSFPNWDSNDAEREKMFDHIPFEVPYGSNGITDEGIYFNIVYAFQVVLMKYFLDCIKADFDTYNFEILDWDLTAYIGKARSAFVTKSASEFLLSERGFEQRKEICKKKIVVPQKSKIPFHTIHEMMDELRGHYNDIVHGAKTLMGVRYFLAYEEIIDRYKGSENIIKWIDMLCDRGVLVTRNYCENGIFYRACRSGETDYDLLEKKSAAIVVAAANACGESYKGKNDKWFSSISPTYLNKVLANFVCDYPREDYDCHTLFSRPYYFGPLVYMQDRINGYAELPLYSIGKISKYCRFDSTKRMFVALSNKNQEVKEELSNRIGGHDDIPYIELTAYLGFLRYVKEKNGTDNFLNALSICRDQDKYLFHVYYNLREAYRNIMSAQKNTVEVDTEKQLRQASKLVNSAQIKLKYEQSKVKKFVEELTPDMVYERTQQRIVESFVVYDKDFSEEIIPILKQVANLEFLLVNAMLFDCLHETKYWKNVYGHYLKQDAIRNNNFVLINDMVATYRLWDDERHAQYKNLYNLLFEICIGLIREKLGCIYDKGFGGRSGTKKSAKRNRQRVVNNIERHIYKQEYKNILVLHFTFSGYQNINDEKEADIVKNVQDIVTVKFEGGKLICDVDENGYGVYVSDTLENAITFVNELLVTSRRYSNVFFRFGCGYRDVDYTNCKKDIEEALLEAQNSACIVKDRNCFIANETSYYHMKNVEDSECVHVFKPLREKDGYYEYRGDEMMKSKIKKYDTDKDETIKIGIITALAEERTAMEAMLENKQNIEFLGRGMGNQFVLGNITANDTGIHRIALARTSGDGNNKAAIRAAKLVEHFPKLEVIFMVGIAGGTPVLPNLYGDGISNHLDKHVRLGDIVVSGGIFQYDYVKDGGGEFVFKGNNIPPCSKVYEAQQRLEELSERDENDMLPWNVYIKQALGKLKSNYERPDCSTDQLRNHNGELIEHPMDVNRDSQYPKIFKGKIASSNAVLKNPQKRDKLKREHDVYAIEMETSGIADTTWEAGIGYYGVRGICDYCDCYKNDIWHRYAALAAAAYTKALIEWMPT